MTLRLFIDQPVGVGFSYGDSKVGSAVEAASDIWKVRSSLVVRVIVRLYAS